jgi:hypothetical protein
MSEESLSGILQHRLFVFGEITSGMAPMPGEKPGVRCRNETYWDLLMSSGYLVWSRPEL